MPYPVMIEEEDPIQQYSTRLRASQIQWIKKTHRHLKSQGRKCSEQLFFQALVDIAKDDYERQDKRRRGKS